MTTIKQNGNSFFDFFSKQHDDKLLLTGNLKQADVAGLHIQDSFTMKKIQHTSTTRQFGTTPLSELETGQSFLKEK